MCGMDHVLYYCTCLCSSHWRLWGGKKAVRESDSACFVSSLAPARGWYQLIFRAELVALCSCYRTSELHKCSVQPVKPVVHKNKSSQILLVVVVLVGGGGQWHHCVTASVARQQGERGWVVLPMLHAALFIPSALRLRLLLHPWRRQTAGDYRLPLRRFSFLLSCCEFWGWRLRHCDCRCSFRLTGSL